MSGLLAVRSDSSPIGRHPVLVINPRSGGGKVSSTAAGTPASALDPALHTVFVGSAAVAVVLLVAVLLMPRTPAQES